MCNTPGSLYGFWELKSDPLLARQAFNQLVFPAHFDSLTICFAAFFFFEIFMDECNTSFTIYKSLSPVSVACLYMCVGFFTVA